MFFKRLSTALCAMVCFSGFVLGANPETGPNANVVGTTQSLLAPLAFTPVITAHDPKCSTDEDGYFEISILNPTDDEDLRYEMAIVLDGNPLPTVTWNGTVFKTDSIFAPGTYYLTVRELSTGDPYPTQDRTIIPPSPVKLNPILISSPSCSSQEGFIEVSASGGSGNYTYYLNIGQVDEYTSPNGFFPSLSEKTYFPIVFDDNNCSDQLDAIRIEIADQINPTNVELLPIECEDGFGSIKIHGLPADQDQYAIRLNGSATGFSVITNGTSATLSNIAAGSYNLDIVSETCTTTDDDWTYGSNPIVFEDFIPLTLNWDTDPDIASVPCFNNTLNINVSVSGGKSSSIFEIKLFENNIEVQANSNLPAGEDFTLEDLKTTASYRVEARVVGETCDPIIKSFNIDGPTVPFVLNSLTPTNETCDYSNDGQVLVNYSGGSGAITWTMDGSTFNALPADNIIKNLSADSYTIYLADDNCETASIEVDIDEPAQLVATHNAAADVDVSCPGGNDGEISVSVTGGNGGYTYDLTGDENRTRPVNENFEIRNLSAGSYNVLVKDNVGCEALVLSGIEIQEPFPIVVNSIDFENETNIVCYGESTSVSIDASGGASPFLSYYLIKAGINVDSVINTNGIATFDNLLSGTYNLSIVGDPNCVPLDTSFIIRPTRQLKVLNYSDTITVDCANQTADLLINVSGDYPFTYQLDNEPETVFNGGTYGSTTIEGISASIYPGTSHEITIRDKNGCPIVVPVTVIEPELLNATLGPIEDVSCLGKGDGSFELEISGGTPGYNVSFGTREVPTSGGVVKINNVSAGVYDVQVTDANNCRLEALVEDVTIEEPADSYRIEPAVIVDPIICPGGIAEVVISTSGGWNGSSEITLTGNDTTIVQAAGSSFFLEEGSYTAYARNEDGCQFTRTISIAAPDPLVITVTDKQDVSCAGADDAQFTINVNQNGGTAPYKYGFSGVGSADVDFTGNSVLVSSGIIGNTTYNVVVADVNGCQSNVVPITINEPDPVVFEYRFDSVSCNGLNDARINIINASGGSGTGYQTWLTPQGQAETQRTFPTITGLAANTYSLRVTDNSGICTSEAVSVKIFEPSQILFIDADFEIEGIRCYGIDEGRIFINADGGLPYNLEYKITTNSGFDSGYSTEQEYTNLAPGDYTAWVRNDRGNCEMAYPTPLTVKNVDELVVNAPDVNDVSCHNLKDGNVQIEATGGTGTLTYTLTDAAATIANNPNTTGFFNGLGDRNKSVTNYEYEVVDINGCAETGNFSVGNPPELVLSILDQTDVVCHNDKNGTMLLRATGGTLAVESDYGFYDLNNSALTYDVAKQSDSDYLIQNIGTTQPVALYHPIVRDDNNCTDTLSVEVEITNPEQVRIADVIWGEKDCWGSTTDSTIVFATGGVGEFRYSLDGGQSLSAFGDSIFIGEAVGNKIVYIEDENGCSALADDTYEYTQPDPLTVNYLLYGYKCSYDPSADMELKITGGTGNYALAINDPNFEGSVYSINPSASGDTTYYVFSENLIQLDPETQYDFYLRDENNCHIENIAGINTYSDEFADTLFNIPEELVLETLTPRGVKCSNDNSGQIQFKASGGTVNENGGYVLTVYHNERTMGYPKRNKAGLSFVENVFSGLHKAYLTDANGCEATTRLSPISNFDTITVPSENESIELITEIVDPTCDLTFDGELIISVDKFRDMGFTAYVDLLDVETGEYYKFDENDTIPADRNFYNIENEGDTLFYLSNQLVADNVGIGTYALRVMDNYSYCETYDTLDVFSVDSLDCPDQNNYILFTPHNGDDLYDEWRIIGSQFQRYNLRVYTAYGELVYSDKGLADGEGVKWEGIDDRGTPVPAGTYIYLLNQHMGTPQDTTIHGNVTILRGSGR